MTDAAATHPTIWAQGLGVFRQPGTVQPGQKGPSHTAPRAAGYVVVNGLLFGVQLQIG